MLAQRALASTRETIRVLKSGNGLPGGPMPTIEAGVAAVVLEALANARRHGAATRITATLVMRTNALVLEVVDNGCGRPSALRRAREQGLGLALIRAHVERLHGRLRMRDAPGGGTLVRAVFPIDPPPRQPLGQRDGSSPQTVRR